MPIGVGTPVFATEVGRLHAGHSALRVQAVVDVAAAPRFIASAIWLSTPAM